MTDPWATPARDTGWVADPWAAPGSGGYGWGAPPPPPPPRSTAWLPLVVVVVVAVAAAVVAIVVRPRDQRAASPPAPHQEPQRPVRTVPAPQPTAKAEPPVRQQSPSAAPQPVRTYTAPPSGIPVRGRVLDTNGRPVAGAAVRLQEHVGFFESLAIAFTAVASLGLVCLTDICHVPYGEGRTAADGTYTVFLEKAKDTYSLTVMRGDGPTFSADVEFAGRPLRLPDVVFWDPAPTVERRGHDVVMRFRAPPARLGSWQGAEARVSGRKGEPLLTFRDVSSGDAFDARLVEDAATELSIGVRVASKFGVSTYFAEVPLRGGPRAVSRGRPCYEYGRSGKAVTRSPCGLTDGNLVTDWTPKVPDWTCKDGSPCDRKVTVDLGSVRRVSFVVVHGCKPFFDEVAVSADGRAWTTVVDRDSEQEPMDDGCHAELDAAARYVRVTGPAGGFYLTRAEISVF